MGFRAAMRDGGPGHALIEATDTDGIDNAVRDQTISLLAQHPEVTAVYSIGVATKPSWPRSKRWVDGVRSSSPTTWTRTTCRSSGVGRSPRCCITTLRHDMRRACQVVMQANGAIEGPIESIPSQINITTPFNVPA